MHVFLNTYSYRPQNFSGRDDVRKKADAFCDELITETSAAGMQTRRVPQLIRKYLPQTAIKRISAKAKGYDNIGGLYRMDIEYNPSRNMYQIKNRVLSLRTPENSDKKSIDKYLCSVAHEVTHGLQSFDNDIRDDKAITEALSDIPMEKWTDMADIAYRTFEKTEKEMLFPMIRAHRDIMYYNSATPFCTRTNREKMKKLIDAKLEKVKSEHPNIDIQCLKKIMYLQAMNEFDAYTTEEKVYAKLNPGVEKSNFVPYLYLCLADCLKVNGVK